MKKVISVLLLIIIFCFVFSTTCLANENQKIIIKGEIKENLTKIMTVSALTDFTIDWGDGVVETFAAGTNLEKSHTYSADGSTKVYQIVITGVDIENFKSMYSEITDIDFSGISTLKSINISGNKISNLTSLAKNKGLVELRCRNCSFLELDTEEFTNLEILDCANNYLSSLNIPTSIKELYIEGNSISVLDTDSIVIESASFDTLVSKLKLSIT